MNTIHVETEEVPTEDYGLIAIAGDEVLHLGDAFPVSFPTSRTQHLCISHGRYAYVTADNKVCSGDMETLRSSLQSLATSKSARNFVASSTMAVQAPISHVAYSHDGMELYVVAVAGGIMTLDALNIDRQGGMTETLQVVDILPNPTNLVLAILDITGQLIVRESNVSKQIADQITAISWSKKGKQIVAGTDNGDLKQFTPQGEHKDSIPPPSSEVGQVVAVSWLENHVFLVAYSNADGEVTVYLIRRTPSKELKYILIANPSLSFGDTSHPTSYNFLVLSNNLVATTSTTSADIGLISLKLDASLGIENETEKATLRFSTERDIDVSITGVALETLEENDQKLLWYVDNDGGCGAFSIRDSQDSLFDKTTEQIAQSSTPAQVKQAPAFGTGINQTSNVSPFGSSTKLTQPSAQSPFGFAANQQSAAPGFGFGFASNPTVDAAPAFSSFSNTTTPAATSFPSSSAFGKPGFGFSSTNVTSAPAFGSSGFAPSSGFGFGSSTSLHSFQGFGNVSNLKGSSAFVPSSQPGFSTTEVSEMQDSDEEPVEDKLGFIDEVEPQNASTEDPLAGRQLDLLPADGSEPGSQQDAHATQEFSQKPIESSNQTAFGSPFTFPKAALGGFGFASVKQDSTTTESSPLAFGTSTSLHSKTDAAYKPSTTFNFSANPKMDIASPDTKKNDAADEGLSSNIISDTIGENNKTDAGQSNLKSALSIKTDKNSVSSSAKSPAPESVSQDVLEAPSEIQPPALPPTGRNEASAPLVTPVSAATHDELHPSTNVLGGYIDRSSAKDQNTYEKQTNKAEDRSPVQNTKQSQTIALGEQDNLDGESGSMSSFVDITTADLPAHEDESGLENSTIRAQPPASSIRSTSPVSRQGQFARFESEDESETGDYETEDDAGNSDEEDREIVSERDEVSDQGRNSDSVESAIEDDSGEDDSDEDDQDASDDKLSSEEESTNRVSSAFAPKKPAFSFSPSANTTLNSEKRSPFQNTGSAFGFGSAENKKLEQSKPFDFRAKIAGGPAPQLFKDFAKTQIQGPAADSIEEVESKARFKALETQDAAPDIGTPTHRSGITEETGPTSQKENVPRLPEEKQASISASVMVRDTRNVATGADLKPTQPSSFKFEVSGQPSELTESAPSPDTRPASESVKHNIIPEKGQPKLKDSDPFAVRSGVKVSTTKTSVPEARVEEVKEQSHEPDRKTVLRPYLALDQPKVDESQNLGLGQKMEDLYERVNRDLAVVAHNMDIVSDFFSQIQDSPQSIDNISQVKTEVSAMSKSVRVASESSRKYASSLDSLKSNCVRLEAQKVKLQRMIRAQTDPTFSATLKLSSLGPEHAAHQRDLRRLLQTTEKQLDEFQSSLSLLKAKVVGLSDGKDTDGLSFERITHAITNLTQSAGLKAAEIDELQRMFVAVHISSPEASLLSASTVLGHTKRKSWADAGPMSGSRGAHKSQASFGAAGGSLGVLRDTSSPLRSSVFGTSSVGYGIGLGGAGARVLDGSLVRQKRHFMQLYREAKTRAGTPIKTIVQ